MARPARSCASTASTRCRPTNAFLKRNWDKIKTAYKPLFAHDSDEDGTWKAPR